MKNVYKTVVIVFFGVIMISAQGVEGQPRNKQSKNGDRGDRHEKQYNEHRKVVGYDQGFHSGMYHGAYGRKRDKQNPKYDGKGRHLGHAKKFTSNVHFNSGIRYGASFGQIAMHRGRMFRLHDGLFYVTRHGRWVATPGPVGIRVMRLPNGVKVFRTKQGALYEFRGTYYAEARGGIGYIVTNAPHRGYRRGW